MANTINPAGLESPLKTYGPGGQPKNHFGVDKPSFSDFITSPVKSAIEASRAHEEAIMLSQKGQLSTQQLMEIATTAEIEIQSAKAIWDKTLEAFKDITKSGM